MKKIHHDYYPDQYAHDCHPNQNHNNPLGLDKTKLE